MKRFISLICFALMVSGTMAQIDLMQGRPNSDMHSTSTFFNPVITGVHVDAPYVAVPTGLLRADEVSFASPQQASVVNRLLNPALRKTNTTRLQNVASTMQNISHLSNVHDVAMADEQVIRIPLRLGVRSAVLSNVGASLSDVSAALDDLIAETSPTKRNVKPITPPSDPLPDPIGTVPFAFFILLSALYTTHRKNN